MAFKAFEPSEAMIQALQQRLGQGQDASKGTGEGGSAFSASASTFKSTPAKFRSPQVPMLGVHSEETGSGSWNSIESRNVSASTPGGNGQVHCTLSDGKHQATSHGSGNAGYSSSSLAPQSATRGSGFNIDNLSGTGPSMSSSARMSLPGAGVGFDDVLEKQIGGTATSNFGSSHSKSMESLQSLPEDRSSLPPRPSPGKFGMVKASSSLYPRPASASKKDTAVTTSNDIASREPEISARPTAPSAPYMPSTPVLPYEIPTSQTCQPTSQECNDGSGEQTAEEADGDLVYLGAGLYGRHTESQNKVAPPASRKPQKKERVKVLPGRVAPLPQKLRVPPRQPGPLKGAGEQILDPMPMPPRSMNLEATERIAASMREKRAQSAKRTRSQDSFTCPAFGSSAPGRIAQGNSAPPSSRSQQPGALIPLPNACGEREKKRLENQEARRQARACPLETPECQTNRSRLSHISSAPSLGVSARPVMERPVQDVFVPSAEEIEKQKMRLACKMEILGFYDGYRGALCKMTADQNKKLASKLNSHDTEAVTDSVKKLNKERQAQLDEWSQKADNQRTVQRRLKLINEFYSDAFTGDGG